MSLYRIALPARRDLRRIWTYIAAQNHNPTAADQLLDRLDDAFATLGKSPLLGEECPHLRDVSPNIRRFTVGNYVIYYQPTSPRIRILHVLHGARDVQTAFLDML